MILMFDTREKVVGLFMITVFILLMVMVVAIGRGKDWFRDSVIYYTSFEQSYNLEVNASVKQYNADIGWVKKISLEKNRVKVTLAIFDEYVDGIRQDSIATVESVNYIGTKYISITAGSDAFAPVEKGGYIQSQARTSLAEILDEFEVEKTAKMVIKAVQNLADLTRELKDPKGPFLMSLQNINSSLAQVERRVGAILDNVEIATGKVPGTIDTLNRDLAKVEEIGDQLLQNIDQLKQILKNIEEGSRDVPPITRTTRKGIAEIRNGVENIDDAVKSIKKNVFIRSNLPPKPDAGAVDAGLRD